MLLYLDGVTTVLSELLHRLSSLVFFQYSFLYALKVSSLPAYFQYTDITKTITEDNIKYQYL